MNLTTTKENIKEEFEQKVKECQNLSMPRHYSESRFRLTGYDKEKGVFLTEKGKELLEQDFILVSHMTTSKWTKEFLEKGFDSTKIPPDHQLGRLTVLKDGGTLWTPIHSAGLYVGKVKNAEGVVLLAVKPDELLISKEAAQHKVEDGLTGLLWLSDAILFQKFPPERVLGRTEYIQHYDPKWVEKCPEKRRKENPTWGCWIWEENPKTRQNPELSEILDCLTFDQEYGSIELINK